MKKCLCLLLSGIILLLMFAGCSKTVGGLVLGGAVESIDNETKHCQLGKTAVTDDCEFTLIDRWFTESYDNTLCTSSEINENFLKPDNSWDTRHASDGKIFFCFDFKVKNVGKNKNDIQNSIELVYADRYSYTDFFAYKKTNSEWELNAQWEAIEPLEEFEYRIEMEVPKELYTNSKESLKLIFHYGSTDVEYSIR